MRILKFEIKTQISTFVIWTTAIVAILLCFTFGVYPVFSDSVEDILKMMEGLPPQFMAAFGFDFNTMFSFGGFYSFTFTYISLMGSIMAAYLGISTFSRESRMKCSEFLLTKPVSREQIFIDKLLSGLVIIVATNVLYVVVALIIGVKQDTKMLLPALALFFTQLVFYALGIFYATFAKKVRSVSGMATVFGFGAFILSALTNLLKEEALRLIAPLRYFDPTEFFNESGYDWNYAFLGLFVVVICILAAFIHFKRSDIKSV